MKQLRIHSSKPSTERDIILHIHKDAQELQRLALQAVERLQKTDRLAGRVVFKTPAPKTKLGKAIAEARTAIHWTRLYLRALMAD